MFLLLDYTVSIRIFLLLPKLLIRLTGQALSDGFFFFFVVSAQLFLPDVFPYLCLLSAGLCLTENFFLHWSAHQIFFENFHLHSFCCHACGHNFSCLSCCTSYRSHYNKPKVARHYISTFSYRKPVIFGFLWHILL